MLVLYQRFSFNSRSSIFLNSLPLSVLSRIRHNSDNGTEFKGVHNLEFTENGARRTRIFYCDPQASWQKGRVEKNHVLIRQILPKGTKFSTLSDESVHLITEHINSVTRELFENQTPFDLMSQKDEYKKLLDTLGLQPIPLDEVCLKPALLKRK